MGASHQFAYVVQICSYILLYHFLSYTLKPLAIIFFAAKDSVCCVLQKQDGDLAYLFTFLGGLISACCSQIFVYHSRFSHCFDFVRQNWRYKYPACLRIEVRKSAALVNINWLCGKCG